MNLKSKAVTLQNILESASKGGVLIYKGDKVATPMEIALVQNVNEDSDYIPEFVVKDSDGNLREIWYGTFRR